MTTTERLRELERSATAGPWVWRWPSGSREGPTIVHPNRGLLLVMDAVRSGMNSATLRFARRTDSMGGTMHNADSWMPHSGGDRPDYQTPTNPDMRLMTECRNALPAMLAVIEAAEAYATACDQSVGEKLMRLQSTLAAFREVRE